jgi:hypothetical protein
MLDECLTVHVMKRSSLLRDCATLRVFKVLKLSLVVVLAGFVASCGPRVPAPLFPGATEVRIFAADVPPMIDRAGHVSAQDNRSGPGDPPSILKGGDLLTPQEVTLLRKSVFYTRPPQAIAACCVPRHLFVFYGPNHAFLGDLRVCFQCGCAEIEPSSPASRELNWVTWDEGAVRKIVRTHHLELQPTM